MLTILEVCPFNKRILVILKNALFSVKRSRLLSVSNWKKKKKRKEKIMILSLGKTCWMSLKKFTSKFLVCWLKYIYIIKNYSRTWWTRIYTIHFCFYLCNHTEPIKPGFQSGHCRNFNLILWLQTKDFFFLIQLGCTVQNWFFKKLKNVNKLKYRNVFKFS